MNKYVFVLGNNYKLSILEILNYFNVNNLSYEGPVYSSKILILSSKNEIDCQNMIDILGGTIKIGKFMSEVDDINENVFEEIILDNCNKNKRISFGFDIFLLKDKFNFKIKNLGLTIKNNLKTNYGCSCRLVMDKNIDILSSVTTTKNNLLKENGFEFLITKIDSKFLIFKIESSQDFENYSDMDFGRPGRDSNSGMLPPKLAKMMINISKFIDNKNITVLDPFCGSGTMIAELILLGYKNIIGSDISERAIDDSKENTNWIIERYNIKEEDFNIYIFKEDIENIDSKIKKDEIDLIVTEPYLGPADLNISDIKRIEKVIYDLELSYVDAFEKMYDILKKNGEIIIVFPVFKININNKISFLKLNIIDKIKNIGFEKENYNKLNIDIFDEILYSRDSQKVFREIHKFIKK